MGDAFDVTNQVTGIQEANIDASGNATFQANARYSGPRRAQVKYVKEVAFTTATAEVARLEQGALSVGYIDPSMLTSVARRPGAVGANLASLASRYRIDTGSPWAFNYAPFNFNAAVPGEVATAQQSRIAPFQSIVSESDPLFVSPTKKRVSGRASSAIGILIKKTHLQLATSISIPLTIGPSPIIVPMVPAQIPIAFPCSRLENMSQRSI